MKNKREKDVFELDIDGKTVRYPIIKLPDQFIEWNLGQRLKFLERTLNPQAPSTGAPGGFGAHLPVYVTQNPKDSPFPANAANKGTGFVAKEEYLQYYIDKFEKVLEQTNFEREVSEKELAEAKRLRAQTIYDFYSDKEKIDFRCMAGLEIWPGNTSRNFKLDPRVSAHFLGMPLMMGAEKPSRYQQWQVNCIWEEISPEDIRYKFGQKIRELTLGPIGRKIVPGHVPLKDTPTKGKYPFGWILWVIEAVDKGIDI